MNSLSDEKRGGGSIRWILRVPQGAGDAYFSMISKSSVVISPTDLKNHAGSDGPAPNGMHMAEPMNVPPSSLVRSLSDEISLHAVMPSSPMTSWTLPASLLFGNVYEQTVHLISPPHTLYPRTGLLSMYPTKGVMPCAAWNAASAAWVCPAKYPVTPAGIEYP